MREPSRMPPRHTDPLDRFDRDFSRAEQLADILPSEASSSLFQQLRTRFKTSRDLLWKELVDPVNQAKWPSQRVRPGYVSSQHGAGENDIPTSVEPLPTLIDGGNELVDIARQPEWGGDDSPDEQSSPLHARFC